jgi:hypothetical protein
LLELQLLHLLGDIRRVKLLLNSYLFSLSAIIAKVVTIRRCLLLTALQDVDRLHSLPPVAAAELPEASAAASEAKPGLLLCFVTFSFVFETPITLSDHPAHSGTERSGGAGVCR